VTVTTVGYGDIVPVTGAGKFFASIIILLGIGLFALLTANISPTAPCAIRRACDAWRGGRCDGWDGGEYGAVCAVPAPIRNWCPGGDAGRGARCSAW